MERTGLSLVGLGLGVGLTVSLATAGGVCSGSFPEVVFSEIPGHPTAQAPGIGIEFTGFLSLYTSPDGSWYIFKAFIDDPENDVVVVGSDLSAATVVAWENHDTPIAGTVHSFLDSDCGVNNDGVYAYGSRLDGATTGTDEVIFSGTGAVQFAAVVEGDPAPGLTDPSGAGDEIYGNSLNSVHVLADGTVGYKADLIDNIDSDWESALYHGMVPVSQEGMSVPFGGGSVVLDSFIGLSGNTFSSSPDGSVWIVEADIDPTFSSQEAVVVNNTIEIYDGMLIKDANAAVDGVFAVDVDNQGNWYARGDFADDTDWVVRNGVVIAMTGMPIFPGSTETWGDTLSGVTGFNGDYAVTGNTSEPDADRDTVIVINGETVFAREGDAVTISGSQNAEIASFSAEDFALGAVPKAFVTLRDADSGADLGDAMIQWSQVAGCSPADIAEPCGVLDLGDVDLFVTSFLAMDDLADFAEPLGVFDLADLNVFVTTFVAGCP